jgi:protein TonB
VVAKDPPPPASVAKKAPPLWVSLAPLPPLRPAAQKAFGKPQAVQNVADLAAMAGRKITLPPAPGGGAAIQHDVADRRAMGSPSPRPAAGSPSPRPAAGNPAPRYPARAQRRGWQGRVLLRLAITAAGKVGNVSLVQSSGHAVLDRAAKLALKYWRFDTASHGAGPRIIAEVMVPVVFRLHGEDGAAVDTKFAER